MCLINIQYSHTIYCILLLIYIFIYIPGAFCKDQVYLVGALQILKRRHEIDFGLLIRMGKIAYEDVEMLVMLAELDETRVPHFMNNMTAYRTNINRIAESNGLTDEILRDVD